MDLLFKDFNDKAKNYLEHHSCFDFFSKEYVEDIREFEEKIQRKRNEFIAILKKQSGTLAADYVSNCTGHRTSAFIHTTFFCQCRIGD